MPRLLFEKTGNAVWISHLDLMRLFQRAFKRAGLPLTHTQGYNPRPSVSIALPLSVGIESRCELLDFSLDGRNVPCEQIRDLLNTKLIPGIRVLDCYDTGAQKIKNLAFLDCAAMLEYDGGVPCGAVEQIEALFAGETVIVEKKSKSAGIQEQDILPMIRSFSARQTDLNTVTLRARICCQNPTLNPMQLSAAIVRYLPEFRPDFSHFERLALYCQDGSVFR